jgi:hypothetical protein
MIAAPSQRARTGAQASVGSTDPTYVLGYSEPHLAFGGGRAAPLIIEPTPGSGILS